MLNQSPIAPQYTAQWDRLPHPQARAEHADMNVHRDGSHRKAGILSHRTCAAAVATLLLLLAAAAPSSCARGAAAGRGGGGSCPGGCIVATVLHPQRRCECIVPRCQDPPSAYATAVVRGSPATPRGELASNRGTAAAVSTSRSNNPDRAPRPLLPPLDCGFCEVIEQVGKDVHRV